MAEIIVCEFMDEAIARERFAGWDLLFDPSLVDDPERLLIEVPEAKALIVRNQTQVRGILLDRAENLKVIGRLGVGLDNIDLNRCRERNIAVCPAGGANDLSVAEYVLTAAMILLRSAWNSTPAMISGAWPRNEMIGQEISGKTLGLVGYGSIARETASHARSLGMRVIAYDPYLPPNNPLWNGAKSVDFKFLLSDADVISIHTPLNRETHGLIDQGAISTMHSDAILINAARGGIIVEAALANALREGKLGGAALDVYEQEPLTAEAGEKFSGLNNILLTPHIAGVTRESNVRISNLTAKNVLDILNVG